MNGKVLPLMAMAMVALVAALWAGLLRFGWSLPSPRPSFLLDHGPLMVGGFLGTLVGLERAVALKRWWGYGAPLFTGIGGLAVIAGVSGPAAPAAILLGSTVLMLIFLGFIRRQSVPFLYVLALGVLIWWVGNLLWFAGWAVHRVV